MNMNANAAWHAALSVTLRRRCLGQWLPAVTGPDLLSGETAIYRLYRQNDGQPAFAVGVIVRAKDTERVCAACAPRGKAGRPSRNATLECIADAAQHAEYAHGWTPAPAPSR